MFLVESNSNLHKYVCSIGSADGRPDTAKKSAQVLSDESNYPTSLGRSDFTL